MSAVPKRLISFDVESNGLHGAAFAIGAVMIDGGTVDEFFARCPISEPVDPWVAANVLPALNDASVTHDSPRAMRDAFWLWLMSRKTDAVIVCDCGWPVEAGLLSACVTDDPARAFAGPYPLHEVATLLLAAGMDPLGSYAESLLSEAERAAHRPHHPVDDARLSALCAVAAMIRLGLRRPPDDALTLSQPEEPAHD